MSTLNRRTLSGAVLGLRPLRCTQEKTLTSYPVSSPETSSQRDETELSWENIRENNWPSDAWVVGCAVPVNEWPEYFGREGRDHLV